MPSMTSRYWRAQISFDFSHGWPPTIGNLGRKFTHLTPELYAMIVYKWALRWLWNHQAQVDDIEIVVASNLILALCDLVCMFFLNPDVSYEALGGVLPQNPLWGSQCGLVECLQRFLSQTLHNIKSATQCLTTICLLSTTIWANVRIALVIDIHRSIQTTHHFSRFWASRSILATNGDTGTSNTTSTDQWNSSKGRHWESLAITSPSVMSKQPAIRVIWM